MLMELWFRVMLFFSCCVFALAVFVGWRTITAHAQEQDATYPQTKTWVISVGDNFTPNVSVIDTAGVCLYLIRQSPYSDRSATIAAVPKTALKPGIGCQ